MPIDLLQDVDSLNVLIDDVSPERAAGGFQQLRKLIDAFQQLPDRCRDVVWLRKIEDVPQKEVAARLNITVGTFEAHLSEEDCSCGANEDVATDLQGDIELCSIG